MFKILLSFSGIQAQFLSSIFSYSSCAILQTYARVHIKVYAGMGTRREKKSA